jgi:hypothetical protein
MHLRLSDEQPRFRQPGSRTEALPRARFRYFRSRMAAPFRWPRGPRLLLATSGMCNQGLSNHHDLRSDWLSCWRRQLVSSSPIQTVVPCQPARAVGPWRLKTNPSAATVIASSHGSMSFDISSYSARGELQSIVAYSLDI